MMARVALVSVGLLVIVAGFFGHQRMARIEDRLARIEDRDAALPGGSPSPADVSYLGRRIQRLEARVAEARGLPETSHQPNSESKATATPANSSTAVPPTAPPTPAWEWTPLTLTQLRQTPGFESFAHPVRETTLEILMRLPRAPTEAELLGVASAVRNWRSDIAGLDSYAAPERDRRREDSDQRFRSNLQAHFPGPEGLSLSSGLVSVDTR